MNERQNESDTQLGSPSSNADIRNEDPQNKSVTQLKLIWTAYSSQKQSAKVHASDLKVLPKFGKNFTKSL